VALGVKYLDFLDFFDIRLMFDSSLCTLLHLWKFPVLPRHLKIRKISFLRKNRQKVIKANKIKNKYR